MKLEITGIISGLSESCCLRILNLYASGTLINVVEFNRKQMKEMARWVQREAKNIVFIYGLLDVYSAAKINLKRNASCTLLVSPVQDADCRIEAFDWETKNYLKDLIVSDYRDFRQH